MSEKTPLSATEQTVTNDMLQQKLDEAEAINRWYAMWAHEIRTPLLVVEQGLKNLAELGLKQDNQAWLSLSQSALEQAGLSLNDMLSLSQLQQQRILIQHNVFRLDSWWQALILSAQALIGKKEIVFKSKPMVLGAWLEGDAYRLKQILLNLLSNAIKFTPEGGRVELTFELTDKACRFSVTDTGEGLNSDALALIRQPFQQFVHQVGQASPGTGLGLFIVQQLVNAMHARMVIDSAPGKGSCFEVIIPWRSGVSIDESVPSEVEVLSPKMLKVLLVDDSRIGREAIKHSMQDFNHIRWLEADSVSSALSLMAENQLDYAIVDQCMPNASGESLCVELNRARINGKQGGLKRIALISAEPIVSPCADVSLLKPMTRAQLVSFLGLSPNPKTKKTVKSKKIVCKKVIHDKIPTVLTELFPKFVNEVNGTLGDLEQALAVADWSKQTELAHKLKGSCMVFGLNSLVRMLLILEQAIRKESTVQISVQLDKIRAAVASLNA